MSRESEIQRWLSSIVLDARVYVNTEQIVPMPRLRVNPTILWLPNIVISLVSIIYISSKHFLRGEIRRYELAGYCNVDQICFTILCKIFIGC